MNTTLQPNEKLIHAGEALLRLQDGTLLKGVPQYMAVDNASPTAVSLKANERLIMVGSVHTDRKASEKRFAEALAGRKPERKFDGTPLYIKETVGKYENSLSAGEQKILDGLVDDFMTLFATQVQQAIAE